MKRRFVLMAPAADPAAVKPAAAVAPAAVVVPPVDDRFGDSLTPEQQRIADAQKRVQNGEDIMSDEEVASALSLLAVPPKKGSKAAAAADDEVRIPKARFDEAVQKERDRADLAEAALTKRKREDKAAAKAAAKAAVPAAPAAAPAASVESTVNQNIARYVEKVRTDRLAWQKAILNNDEAAATSWIETLATSEQILADLRMTQVSQSTRQTVTEDTNFTRELAALEAEFPIIDPLHADYDQDFMNRLNRVHTGLMQSGYTLTEALRETADIYLEPLRGARAATPAVVVDPNLKAEGEATLRNRAQTSLANAIASQPPAADAFTGARTGAQEPVLKPSRLSQRQFAKLSEEQRAVLRGDYL